MQQVGSTAQANAADEQQVANVNAPVLTRVVHGLALVVGVLLLALLTESNIDSLSIPALHGVTLHVQFALLVGGLLLVALGLGGDLRWGEPHPGGHGSAVSLQREGVGKHTRLWSLLALLLITALALVVRLDGLGTAVRFFVDEVHFSTAVMTLLPAPNRPLLEPFSSITAFPWLYPYWQSLAVSAFGRDLVGLRLVSAIIGALGVPALYLLGRVLFDRPTALLAALLLATFPPHMQFSRIGLNNIADPLAGTLALAFLLRGLRSGRRWDFALGGIALGLTQYFYEGGRFIFPVLVMVWLCWRILMRRMQRRDYDGLARYITAALLTALPVYITLLAGGFPLAQRFVTTGVGGSYWLRVQAYNALQSPERQFIWPFTIYVSQPETAQYYGGELGLILPALVPFFLIGLLALLWRPRAAGVVLLIWVLLTSLGNVLLTDSAISARYVVAFPALMLIAAVGVRTVIALLMWRRGTSRQPAMPAVHHQEQSRQTRGCSVPANARRMNWVRRADIPALLIGLVGVFFAVVQVAYYFGPHLETYNRQIRPFPDAHDALFRAVGLPDATQITVIGRNVPAASLLNGIMGYLDDGKPVVVRAPAELTPDYVAGLTDDVPRAFFIERDDVRTLNTLRQRFTLAGPYASPFALPPEKQFMLYFYNPPPAG
ncbi:MAG: glycosyltransferase family 39 protein [Anaerolineae bacterium]|nr:glycosyltransferase family 39 protein [Anaerolineae bacterium]